MTSDPTTFIVALPDRAKLLCFDTLTNRKIRKVEMEFKSGALALQGQTLFAAVRGGSGVYALNVATTRVRKYFPFVRQKKSRIPS